MGKIFKQLARHWAACLAVVALLFVQAYCDLSLPDYTSRIVDTGIQQGGIESPLPETIRQSTLDALTLLMSEEDADALQNAAPSRAAFFVPGHMHMRPPSLVMGPRGRPSARVA